MKLSKSLTGVLFVILLFVGFYCGTKYQAVKNLIQSNFEANINKNNKTGETCKTDINLKKLQLQIDTELIKLNIAPETDYELYKIESFISLDKWLFFNLTSYPTIKPNKSDLITPNIILGLAYANTKENFELALEKSANFIDMLNRAPNGLLSQEAKGSLKTK